MVHQLPDDLIGVVLSYIPFRDWYNVGKVLQKSMASFIREALGFDLFQTDRLWYYSDDTYRPVHSISKMKYWNGVITIHFMMMHHHKCVEQFECIQDMTDSLFHERPPDSKFTIRLNKSMEAQFVGYLQNDEKRRVGTLVDALDQDFIWYIGRIIEERDDAYLVHFMGWSSRWDTWFPKRGGFLFPLHTFTEDWKMKIQIGDSLEYRYNDRWFTARLLWMSEAYWVIERVMSTEAIHVIVLCSDIDEQLAPMGMHIPGEYGYKQNHFLGNKHNGFSWIRSDNPLFVVHNHDFKICTLMCLDRLQYFTSCRHVKTFVSDLILDTVRFKDIPHNRKKKCRSSCFDVRRQTLTSSKS